VVSNRLSNSQSEYLLQHANNPVDWWPWSQEALDKAKELDLPVFLSIGYSACHWCHVMAHESFEDPEIAGILNENFISIKVDREEHPDVDAIYMEAVQSMTGHGGWPMSVFLMPDGLPFYGGTYFPPKEGTQMPSFRRVLLELSRLYKESRGEVESQAQSLRASIAARSTLQNNGSIETLDTEKLTRDFCDALYRIYDDQWGGTARAPKFIQPHLWQSVLDIALMSREVDVSKDLMNALTTTLDAVIAGGIYDHLGGGFARYSTDAFWMVPHFEKMLYDQALNSRLYLRAYLASKNQNYLRTTVETLDFVILEMSRSDGLFASSFDADSDGEEGAFYIFRIEEVRETLRDKAEEFISAYGITHSGNFEGRNILHRPDRDDLATTPQIDEARQLLLALRNSRNAPRKDSKAVLEWNAMMVATLAEAGFYLNRPDYLERARAVFLHLFDSCNLSGQGLRLAPSGENYSKAPAVLGDYAQMLNAALALVQFGGDFAIIEYAETIFNKMTQEFFDPESGNFNTTARSSTQLIAQSNDIFDSAYESATSTIISSLISLSELLGDEEPMTLAMGLVENLAEMTTKHPSAFPVVVRELAKLGAGIGQLVVVGTQDELLASVRSQYIPNLYITYGSGGIGPLWEGKVDSYAYLCKDFTCSAPTNDPKSLAEQLHAMREGQSA
ncbi:unnamed protein product, partial [Acidithrix sp. C25]